MNNAPFERPSNYVSASKARDFTTLSATTLRNLADAGRLRHIKSPGGKRFYYIPDLKALSGSFNSSDNRVTICYSRVSSSKQREDLDRQSNFLLQHFPTATLITDVGSGLNYNRRGLQQLLTLIFNQSVSKLVVTYRDRLCRYGIELFERIFREFDIEFVVLMQEESASDTTEFAKDILDVCNFFVAQYNGKKSAKYRALRNQTIQIQNESSQRDEEVSTQSNDANQESSSESITRIGETSGNSIHGNQGIVQPVRLFVLQSTSEGSSRSLGTSEKISGK